MSELKELKDIKKEIKEIRSDVFNINERIKKALDNFDDIVYLLRKIEENTQSGGDAL